MSNAQVLKVSHHRVLPTHQQGPQLKELLARQRRTIVQAHLVACGIGSSDLQDLANMHNVIMSSHVAFYTDESIRQITQKTLSNFEGFMGTIDLDEKAFVA